MPEESALVLETQGLARRFGDRQALIDVDLTVAPGEIVFLLGASGCGKSTLLRILAGVDEADAGVIRINGRTASAPGVFVEPEQRGVGLVFQDFALFPHLSVLQNVCFGLRERGEATRGVARAMLSRVGASHLETAWPASLSGGEQQRVALARALAPAPRLLLMDEPFSSLDRNLRQAVRDDAIALLREVGAAAVIVSHDPDEALSVADRIILMRDGRVVQSGTPQALYGQPVDRYAAEFFGALNLCETSNSGGMLRTPWGVFPAPAAWPAGARALAGVRPGRILLKEADAAPGDVAVRIRGRAFCGEYERLQVETAEADGGCAGAFMVHTMTRLSADAQRATIHVEARDLMVFGGGGGD